MLRSQFDFGKYSPNSHAYYERYSYFMEHTGLFDLLENHIINNLVDYVTGVETGLDSNGRKNRGGHFMEGLVESFIKKAGFVKGINYFKEMYIHQISSKWCIDLSAISNRGKMEKRFDFVIKTPTMIYGIETNFYSSGAASSTRQPAVTKRLHWKRIPSTSSHSVGVQTARGGQAPETTSKKLMI